MDYASHHLVAPSIINATASSYRIDLVNTLMAEAGTKGQQILTDNNGSTTTLSPTPEVIRSCVETAVLAVVLGIVIISTITGNVLVICSVLVNANLRTTTHYFIANLAVADLLLGTTVLPFSATLEILQYWVFGQAFCDVWAAIDVLCCTASILSLCVISIDRYIGVTRPLQHATIIRPVRAFYIIIGIWLLSVAISVAPLVGWKEEPDPDPRVCTVTTQPGYVLFSVAGSFYIPCLVIVLVYFRIYQETVKYTKCLAAGAKLTRVEGNNVISLRIHTGRHVRATSTTTSMAVDRNSNRSTYTTLDSFEMECMGLGQTGNLTSTPTSQRRGEKGEKKRSHRQALASKVAKFKREKKAAKTLGIVVGVFITCWLPFFVILPVDSLCPGCVPPILFKFFFWLGYCNSTMNPVIYTCSSLEFRRAFLAILSCKRCHRTQRLSHVTCHYKNKHKRKHANGYASNVEGEVSLPKSSSTSSEGSAFASRDSAKGVKMGSCDRK